MKTNKIIFTLVSITFIIGAVMVSCKPSNKEEKESQEKVEVARENVQDANDSLAVAKRAATDEEWKTFKKETDSIINDNEAQIAELKLRMKKTGKSIDVKYQKNIEILEQKNQDLKVKLDTYKNDANSDWQSFKREFKHDMDGVGKAFRDLTVDNNK
jgi:predicted RNase H-like nuclease (RuvC/YqgF family)